MSMHVLRLAQQLGFYYQLYIAPALQVDKLILIFYLLLTHCTRVGLGLPICCFIYNSIFLDIFCAAVNTVKRHSIPTISDRITYIIYDIGISYTVQHMLPNRQILVFSLLNLRLSSRCFELTPIVKLDAPTQSDCETDQHNIFKI